jgi:small subunit ribosomal protein S9
MVNGKPYQQLFMLVDHRRMIEQPFVVTDTLGKYNVEVKTVGGGVSGQAGAIRHGIARALVDLNESFKGPLRQHGLLTRDPRVKERKKYGLKRARKAPQYTKR